MGKDKKKRRMLNGDDERGVRIRKDKNEDGGR